ncbi:hypothetical protein [Stieleria neptunia]|uniref:hypothetical protein n=1 Tax=Stieleria neptunia TaxID=2527979 RepID=UPI0018D26834|nr:hypothetical protein [Stieleria neptunia]
MLFGSGGDLLSPASESVFNPRMLDIGEPSLSPPGWLPWGNIDSVFSDRFLVSLERIFPDRDFHRHVPKVVVAKIVPGNQLNYSVG